ncbi:hypothetical protein P3T18_006160 [Paraburkholderia sp. GAS199]|uniref:hypothetical protein n=1 Tax=Paraburkholderia sp. GAS199 TaxID=3035126 RepID=UPI003D1EFE40
MRRTSAVTFLVERRRTWLGKIAAKPSGDVEQETREVDSIERLILDVRAGRVSAFELTDSRAVAVIVTD